MYFYNHIINQTVFTLLDTVVYGSTTLSGNVILFGNTVTSKRLLHVPDILV